MSTASTGKLRILTVVGARPQFVKAAVVSRAIAQWNAAGERPVEEYLVHTGQHFDDRMSRVFFEEMDIPEPDLNLQIAGGGHGEMTGRMLIALERAMLDVRPDMVLIYGDTNSTLAGALAAAKLHIPVAHVEAGLRSFVMTMPEEVNRILADRVSSLLFCPTRTAVTNLAREGIVDGVFEVGDVMYDAVLHYRDKARASSNVLASLGIDGKRYVLATCHRAENTDDPRRLGEILAGLALVARTMPVILPIHPRTRQRLDALGAQHWSGALRIIDPVGYFDMIRLEEQASAIVTDSGGVQKEAYFFRVPCVTTRDETEWVETVAAGWNRLVGANAQAIAAAVDAPPPSGTPPAVFGDGTCARTIVELLCAGLPGTVPGQ